MANIGTTFLGLKLKSPVIAGSCGQTGTVAGVSTLARAGVGAVVLKSLFEEQILARIARETGRTGVVYGHGDIDEFVTYYERKNSVDAYIELVKETKERVDIPVIASINAVSDAEWHSFATELSSAGADALQLNLFVPPFDPDRSAGELEETYYNVVRRVRECTDLPVAAKIGPCFTNIGSVVSGLRDAGADAVVLFNRFYTPDFDTRDLSLKPASPYSVETEYLQSLRWTSILSGSLDIPIVGATGIHTGDALIKMMLAGAAAVEVVSTVYRNGPDRISEMNDELSSWMATHSFATLDKVRGRMVRETFRDPTALERVQYLKYFGDSDR